MNRAAEVGFTATESQPAQSSASPAPPTFAEVYETHVRFVWRTLRRQGVPPEDERDAIRIANDTPYGLAAAVWTRDIFRGLRVVKALRAGVVWVNHMQPTFVEAPWGGYKQSGHGRELGKYGLDEYLEVKSMQL